MTFVSENLIVKSEMFNCRKRGQIGYGKILSVENVLQSQRKLAHSQRVFEAATGIYTNHQSSRDSANHLQSGIFQASTATFRYKDCRIRIGTSYFSFIK